ncbi:4-hydroxythreonine-4-phosphate dehydrogenase [Actinophytocola oryzae]|uniref:4-hydroxythreonine-4-phosphate dehydrogenase n=2 Tax=Actinophytocola oryzae TaxID=502181 RepID=A0A4R7W1Z6_9PSEU|nr:4-hydroxythreonine-4-phosphate dehydrogenase PdxA [Actinophytocola oryzae]TDV56596.1 4-hydroxythreonine-4-phosphate dehydrogenase [Actinophytocola oryzae]
MISDDRVALHAVADDLSGAAEVASLLTTRSGSATLVLAGQPRGAVCVTDLDARHLPAEEVSARVLAAVSATPGARVLVKIDSLLRGPLAALVGAVGPVVVAPALPALDRVVAGGVVTVDGRPLAEVPAWAAEARQAPTTVAAALSPLRTTVIPLATIRSPELPAALRAAVAAGLVPVCDATTDTDLDAIVVAAPDGVALAGSGGVAAALGRAMALPHAAEGDRPTTPHDEPLTDWDATAPDKALTRTLAASYPGHPLIVVGTAEAVAREQVRRLIAEGATEVTPGDADEQVIEALRGGAAVLRPTPGAAVDPTRSRAISASLATLAARVVAGTDTPLVLTGGETARRVLDALGVRALHPIDSVHHGAVRSRTDDGRLVVTRPGSFGGPDSLTSIVAALRGEWTHPTEGMSPMTSTNTPLIAVTMGDGAGVGPEVVVGALVEPRDDCRPVVVGDAARLRAAAGVLGLSPEIVTVERVADAEFTPGRINVIDLGLLPADLPWGTLSSVAGHAAYEYVRVAAELALAGDVQGICTAPLNKEALHAAGHRYPGHTEMLAHFCGIDEVSMMLSTPTVRVIHVTTHIGLVDAVNRIEPGLVERTVRRGHDALARAGIPNPRIGVCGINPHAGENGLFGYGEEEEKIVPAIEKLRADGIDARGPLPADTAFFVAGRGDYDLVVAMYHDQGHAPVKVLGIDAGVNITVGLPVIRTSVDHGTAFDIAGTGKVDVRSMIEALRQAAQMSPRPAGATS